MSELSVAAPKNIDLNPEASRLDLVFQGNYVGVIATILNTIAFGYIAWNTSHHLWFVTWIGILNLLSLVRLDLARRWRKLRHEKSLTTKVLKRWHTFMVLSLTGSGIGWGTIGWLSVHSPDPIRETAANLMLSCMVAGALAAYSASIYCMAAVIVPTLSLWICGMIFQNTESYRILALLCALYSLILIYMGRYLNRYSLNALLLNARLAENEERLRLARDSSGAMTWDWDIDTGDLSCEGNLDLFFGEAAVPQTRFDGKMDDYFARIHPADVESFRKLLNAAVENEKGEVDIEHRVIWPDQSIHFMNARGRVICNQNAKPIRITGIFWDITSKKTEEKLRHERDVLAEASRAKLVFLANASHEIRTPLAAINGFAETLLDRPLLDDVREDVHVILRNGKYLVSVVNDLLDLSKSETDRIFIQKTTMSPVREIYDSLLVVKAALQRKGLKLDLLFNSLMPVSIQSDPTRFRQVLINILSNAVKFTNSGRISVAVLCAETGNDQGAFRIQVTDTGLGMSENTQKNLFEPFARGESQMVQRLPGSGLGLALSRSLTRRMGGDLVLVKSSPGMGSCFEMSVETGNLKGVQWVQGESLAHRPTDFAHARSEMTPHSQLKGTRILVAEDDPDLSELMERYLRQQGAYVETCDNGAKAVDRALQSTFDVVLMDIKMPIMDGYQATSILRERGYRYPIVALTAHASSDDQQMCYQAGCDSYLSKPVNTQHLMEVLSKQLHAHA